MNTPAPKEQTLLLKQITFLHTPKIPGLRAADVSSIDIDNLPTTLIGWNFILTSSVLVMISPRGWTPNTATSPTQRDHNGPVQIHTLPRAEVLAHFSGQPEDVEMVINGKRFETGPAGIKKVVVDESKSLLAQIPASQMGDA